MNWREVTASFFWLLFPALCTSCTFAPSEGSSQPRPRVIDLKIASAPIAWVDNDTVLITIDTGERLQRRDGSLAVDIRLATYNYKTGERRTYGRSGSGLCYADGYVSRVYEDEVTGELIGLHGQLGKEQVLKVEPGKLMFESGPTSSCRPWKERPPAPAWAQGKTATMLLWPRTGVIACNVLDYSFQTKTVKASFHKQAVAEGVDLPFSCFDVRRGFKYYHFKQAHFAVQQDLVTPWPIGRDRIAYWLFPDGRVETIRLPYSSAIRENMVPTVRGIVAFSRPTSRDEDYGIYFVTPDRTQLILQGHGFGVTSPDGCKVAVLHDPDYVARIEHRRVSGPATLKLLDVCLAK